MMNRGYADLEDSYLFHRIGQKIAAFEADHPDAHLCRMGIGDVSLPLCDAVIEALHAAVDDQASEERFQGYMPECGADFLREAIARHYVSRGIGLASDEIFVSSGASDDLGSILDIFERGIEVQIMEPAYPAYVDANVMDGNKVIARESGKDNGFLPMPDSSLSADLIYICSPANPTGATYDRRQLESWVEYANAKDAIIIFDAAYEAFIAEEGIPHSIYEVPGAKECAIEICSLSKTAGFTGTRCGYTVIPKQLERDGMGLNAMWVRNRTTRTNGVSYITQRAAEAVFTSEGQAQVKANIDIYKGNAAVLMGALDKLGIWYTGGRNAPYIWLECPGGMGSWEFFDFLLEKANIVGTPGVGFGPCGEGYFRFSSFGSPEDTMLAASRLLALLG